MRILYIRMSMSLKKKNKKPNKQTLNKSLNFLSNVKFTPESEMVRVRGFRTVLKVTLCSL